MTWQRILVDGRLQLRFVPELAHKLPPYLFDQQLPTCQACVHHVAARSAYDDPQHFCVLAGPRVGCSYMRTAAAPCGPLAACFQAAATAPAEPPAPALDAAEAAVEAPEPRRRRLPMCHPCRRMCRRSASRAR